MRVRGLSHWRNHRGSSRLIMIVLIASMMVAGVLAVQAIQAARERRAIGEATLRQYARLAAWEFSRLARRDLEQSIGHTLQARVHPRGQHQNCDCDPIAAPDDWFQVTGAGELRTTSDAVRATLAEPSIATSLAEDRGDGTIRILPLAGDPARFIAMRPEPHLPDGGQVGLVATIRSLAPALSRAQARGSLLPSVLMGDADARTLINLQVVDRAGTTVFESPNTAAGPYVIETELSPDGALPLVTRASMTPAFIDTLGPTPGTLRTALIVMLVVLNALLMAVAIWQLQRERELAKLRGDFVAGVSHELRTPLAQIRMFSETLLLNRVRSAGESKRALEIIGQESIRLSQLVDNVLLFHGSASGDPLEPADVIDLNAFAREVIESFAPLAAAKQAGVVLEVTPEPIRVRADAGRLRQVLLNLLDNAVKFGAAGQVVTVRVTRSADAAVMTVEDRGPGIPAADRRRVFDAFQRGHDTRGTGGAGIGLAVVKQIVDAHRGSVSIEDTSGPGTRLRVELPIAAAPAMDV